MEDNVTGPLPHMKMKPMLQPDRHKVLDPRSWIPGTFCKKINCQAHLGEITLFLPLNGKLSLYYEAIHLFLILVLF